MKAIGRDTAVPMMLKAVRWAMPVHAPTAETAPIRSRHSVTALNSEPGASSPSRIANMEASDNNQFSAGHAMQIRAAHGRKRMKAKPGRGSLSGEAKPASIAAPTSARIAASAIAARKKLRAKSGLKIDSVDDASLETLLAPSLSKYSSSVCTVAIRPMDAATIHNTTSAPADSKIANTARFRLP